MNVRRFGSVAAAAFSVLLAGSAVAQEITVRGGGTWVRDTNAFENHQPYLERTSVEATLYPDGSAGGWISWTSVYNYNFPAGPSTSGYPWLIDVEAWDYLGAGVYVLRGMVVESPQFPEDEGRAVDLWFFDGGPDGIDAINFQELTGNLVIE